VKVVNIVHVQWPINKRTSNSYINSSNASAFWAIFNHFAHDFKVPTPYSAAASHFVMKPPPAIFCGQVDLQVARQSYLRQVSHIQVMWRRRGLAGGTHSSCKSICEIQADGLGISREHNRMKLWDTDA
jgi:hypothetical protein